MNTASSTGSANLSHLSRQRYLADCRDNLPQVKHFEKKWANNRPPMNMIQLKEILDNKTVSLIDSLERKGFSKSKTLEMLKDANNTKSYYGEPRLRLITGINELERTILSDPKETLKYKMRLAAQNISQSQLEFMERNSRTIDQLIDDIADLLMKTGVSKLSGKDILEGISFDFNCSSRQNCIGLVVGKDEVIDPSSISKSNIESFFTHHGFTKSDSKDHVQGELKACAYTAPPPDDGSGMGLDEDTLIHASIECKDEMGLHKHKFGQGPIIIADPRIVQGGGFGSLFEFFKRVV